MREALGYAASSMVLITFLMRSMVPLRMAAILSNLLFLAYGYAEEIHPVFLLHAALLPINVMRLAGPRCGGLLERFYLNRFLLPATDRIRHIAVFVFGFTAGLLGLRPLLHFVLTFLNQCRRNFV